VDKLRAVTFFCRTVEARTIVAAARSLAVVPSALRKVIGALENDLGFKLLHRSTRRLSLTDEGATYYDQCRRILQELEEAEASARLGRTLAKGTLRVGMHPGFRFLVLSELIRYLDANPEVNVETVITNSPSAVIDDGLDLVLRIGRLANSSLVSRQLGWTSAITCASPSYVEKWGEPQRPGDLKRHRAIIPGRRDEESNTRWEFVNENEREVVEVPVRVTVRDGIGLTDAAVGGCGIVRPVEFAARRLLVSGELLRLLPDWSGNRQGVYAVLPPYSRIVPAKMRTYLELFESLLATLAITRSDRDRCGRTIARAILACLWPRPEYRHHRVSCPEVVRRSTWLRRGV
jgi:LysR family transcriptional regulator for bpeEF and oprC